MRLRWRRLWSVCALAAGLGLSLGSVRAHQQHPPIYPHLTARAVFAMDDSRRGRVLFAYRPDARGYPASTAKMMTAIIVTQHMGPDTVVTVPSDAMVGGTTAGLVPGERMSVENLLYGMLLPSGNDAAVTLADAVSGSSWKFAELMNSEARMLHLWHSHFVLPDGLDASGQFTTARDLAWLAHALLQRHQLKQIVGKRLHTVTTSDGVVHRWTTLNRLLFTYPGASGVKTGTTPAAGANLVASAWRNGHRVIAVLMGDSKANRFGDATRLLNYCFQVIASRPGT